MSRPLHGNKKRRKAAKHQKQQERIMNHNHMLRKKIGKHK